MKSITQKTSQESAVNVAPQVSRANRAAERSARAGHWVESLRNSDVNRLWAELHRIVSNHPLVRASRSAGLLIEEGATSAYTDLTQELFVQLLTKSRFQHYLDTGMTDGEIECEIGQIELTNLLTAELRKRHPESYRLARRISTLIQSSTNFRRFDSSGMDNEQHRRLADRVYGVPPNAPSPEQQRVIDTFSAKNPHNPIRHAIYIIKENRTYDQVLGDVREGNGKPDLVLFGEAVTPNQHALARKFVLFDDFYVDGDVSADGHFWSTAAEATDYIRKLWPSTYSEHIKMDIFGGAYDGDERHDHPVAAPASGFIWDAAAAAHLAYRDYGEWCVDDKEHPGRSKAWLRGLQ